MDTKKDREMCEKATKEPWELAGCNGELTGINGPSGYNYEVGIIAGQLQVYGLSDAIFISFARTALPDYITAYEAEKAAREKAEADYDVAKAAVEFFEGEIKELRSKVQYYTSRGLITDLKWIEFYLKQALASTAGQDFFDRVKECAVKTERAELRALDLLGDNENLRYDARADKEEIERLRNALEAIEIGEGVTEWLDEHDGLCELDWAGSIARTALEVERGED